MKVKSLLAISALFLLAACGPIIGQAMVASNGVKDFKVVKGNLADLRAGQKLLVVAPFATTPESFYICRGEDASVFVDSFNGTGLFSADFHMTGQFEDNGPLIVALKKSSPEAIRSKLELAAAPDLLLTGTIVSRETVAAPAKGIVMKVTYRLEFTDLKSGKTTVVEVDVQDYFQECIPTVVKELMKRISG
ncbi:MAG: hypothetical protein C0623_05385 [Desulfuromonas sp.]|nr:MAG: hypothetical protein C0623_05385 [Desulfuromonas sp.]